MEALLTVSEACAVLRISRALIYRLIKEKKLRPVRIGDRTLFTREELQRFIKKSSQG